MLSIVIPKTWLRKIIRSELLGIALLPVLFISATSFFQHGADNCYEDLTEIRYNITNAQFNLSAARDQLYISTEQFLKPIEIASSDSGASVTEHQIRNLLKHMENLLKEVAGTSTVAAISKPLPVEAPPRTEIEKVQRQLNDTLLLAVDYANKDFASSSSTLQQLTQREFELSKECRGTSSTVRNLLYLSLILSVVAPSLAWWRHKTVI